MLSPPVNCQCAWFVQPNASFPQIQPSEFPLLFSVAVFSVFYIHTCLCVSVCIQTYAYIHTCRQTQKDGGGREELHACIHIVKSSVSRIVYIRLSATKPLENFPDSIFCMTSKGVATKMSLVAPK